jgi:hypothetical protein
MISKAKSLLELDVYIQDGVIFGYKDLLLEDISRV